MASAANTGAAIPIGAVGVRLLRFRVSAQTQVLALSGHQGWMAARSALASFNSACAVCHRTFELLLSFEVVRCET